MDFRYLAERYNNAPFTRQVMLDMLKDYKRPNDKISDLIKSGSLISLKKGLYVPGEKTQLNAPEPFLIANYLSGPSYVSLETALAYWDLIPERVYEISSMTMRPSKKINNAMGRFSYRFVPSPYYSFGIKSVELAVGQVALVASPEKALCDKIISTKGLILRSVSQTYNFLIEDLRMNQIKLQQLNLKEISSWITDAPKKDSLGMLIRTLDKL
ncbi:MAG: hypothetical protein LBE37_19345 [Sphingobacterium sp.]|jgi:hypothetical protein|nr:hypothetical protein [Sphingobacterium sp.]